ncbi:hypothetical protein HPB52_003741 [Rhipicephalus sanguineus]|uniref:Gag-like protein n=1 Tax=Rhipicephalus sanguineus TaxID=34632 RepID=A0A9D4PVB5_RHISA|nr:hypothetical protein HPB52_003741 [Rhipicephalus sanguineus]
MVARRATGGHNLVTSNGLVSPLSTSVDPKRPLPIEETQAGSRQERTSSELVPPTPQEGHTIIFRPVGKKSHFLTATRDTIAAYLSGFTATKSVRVNHRRNLVAVDTVASGDISALLGVKKIADIPVKAKILETDTCVGTIYGVDADIDADELAAIIDSSVPLVSCVRRGNAVHITFSGTVVPAEVHLYKQRRPVRAKVPRGTLVRARLPRPLQCARCGIYGHATATCARDRRCLRCGKSHAEGPCPSERPRCLNCQGTHAANEPRCSSWQIQRQAAFLIAASRGKLTRRQALERAQTAAKGKQSGVLAATTTRPGHSFRDALKGRANAAPTSRTGAAGTSASASTPSSAPTSADDPRDTVMAALVAALRALLNSQSRGHPQGEQQQSGPWEIQQQQAGPQEAAGVCRWDRSCKKDVSLHGTRISASLPAFLSYCCSDCSSGEGSGGRCHDGGNSLLFLPLVTVWRVGKLWASTVDAPGPLAVRLSWVSNIICDDRNLTFKRTPLQAVQANTNKSTGPHRGKPAAESQRYPSATPRNGYELAPPPERTFPTDRI